VQALPLIVNAVGLGLVPLTDPAKPMLADAFVASRPFQLALVAVTVCPVCVQPAFHPCVTCWLEVGKVNVRVQPSIGSPRLTTVIEVPKPPCHRLPTV
jgi:hypothetical protein